MIQIQNLDFGYDGKASLFKGLNLTLKPGHIYGLLGKNGAGKSTLLKNMAGLAFPNSGKCLIKGVDATQRLASTLEELFYLAEDVYAPSLTPGQFLKSTAGFYPNFSIIDFYKYLDILDVDPDLLMSKMSYGQQKKALIAFGLATNTSLFIMDEPTNGLDIPSKVQFRKLIASALSNDRCIIISTHQVRDLESLIDTVLILNNHRIVLENTVDELADKLVFGVFPDTAGMPLLYEEDTMRGKHAILQNTDEKYSKIDLELLFNGVTAGSKQLLELLSNAHHE
jgi:ABC-2 type transport system ATP-binding protein